MRKFSNMKWMAAVLAMGMVLAGCNTGGTAQYTTLFEKDSIIDIHIEMDEEDWAAILADATAEEYYSADVTVDGTTVSDVGVRAKGNSSLMSVAGSDSDRYSLRVKFDKYVDDQNLRGLDEFVLNNCFNDPSYMREYLTYEAFRELGADTPLTVYANVYVNGELFGFYLCVEDVDDSFLEREFGDNDGNLYKAGEKSTLAADSNLDTFSLENGDDEELSGLQKLTDILNAMPYGDKGDIESVLDVDSALKYMAVNTVLGSYDSYLGDKAQNFYLYEEDGICKVIPWDYNMSFGGYTGDSGASTTIPIDEPVYGVTIESRPMVQKLLAVDEYLVKYHGYIEILTTYLVGLADRTEELAAIIRPYVEADPSSFYTTQEFDDAITVHEEGIQITNTQIPAGISDDFAQVTPGAVPDDMAQITPGAMPESGQSEMPDGVPGERPSGGAGGFPGGNAGERPDKNQGGGGMQGGGMQGGMPVNSIPVSILDYAAARLASIEQQLSENG